MSLQQKDYRVYRNCLIAPEKRKGRRKVMIALSDGKQHGTDYTKDRHWGSGVRMESLKRNTCEKTEICVVLLCRHLSSSLWIPPPWCRRPPGERDASSSGNTEYNLLAGIMVPGLSGMCFAWYRLTLTSILQKGEHSYEAITIRSKLNDNIGRNLVWFHLQGVSFFYSVGSTSSE